MILHVRSLDVWGHAPGDPDCDCERDDNDEPLCRDMGGFDVNDSFATGSIEVPDTATDADILATLAREGFIKEDATELCEIDGQTGYERAVVESKESGKPVYWLDPSYDSYD